ncbi:hypothetical protein M4I33_15705 [Clostridium sp. LY3-2]|uniref:hypothetical protein n=1 Tax=Clostridium sp. LY3-2 TaxID=2942482 RepID=UPI0021526216|nr:hypothetical protein [Clostridium sp. LY3-2]MCR6516309.1 hypothetical protein [Clostridium sp. LY3-2]
MDEKKVINELKKYNRLKNRTIPNIENKLEVLQYELEGVGAIEYSDMPGPTGCRKENYLKEELLDEKQDLERRLKLHRAFVNYMDAALNNLNDIDRTILIESYSKDKYEGLNTNNVCEIINISLATYYRRKKEVLSEFCLDLM